MSYLLDTSAAVDVIRGRKPAVRARFADAIRRGVSVSLPSVVAFELHYGVERSARREKNAALLAGFLAARLTALPFDHEDAAEAGRLRVALQRAGTPIGPYDLLIAAQANRRGWTLVTRNAAEFRRIPTLTVEDWS